MADFVIFATVVMVLIITKVGNAGVRSISPCGLFGINPNAMDLLPNNEYTSALSSPLPLPTSISTSASIFASNPSQDLMITPTSNDKVVQPSVSTVATAATISSVEFTTRYLPSWTINSSVVPSSTLAPSLPLSSSNSISSTTSGYTSTPPLSSNPIPAAPTERSFASNLSHLFKPFLTESSTSSPVPSPDLFIPSHIDSISESTSELVPESNIKQALLELLLKFSNELNEQ